MNDLISRQAAIDALCSVCGVDCDKSEFVYYGKQEDQVILCPEHYVLTQLPSAQPERKRGKWIPKDDRRYHCSSCDGIAPKGYRWDFCPDCGADMRGGTDGGDNI